MVAGSRPRWSVPAIYSFRGSRPDVLSRIGAWWQCQTLVLPTNYRCGGVVVDTARALSACATTRPSAQPAPSGGSEVAVCR